MKVWRRIGFALLVSVATSRVHASLTWSWEYTEPAVLLQPTESFAAMIQILNDVSSDDDLEIGVPLIVLDPSWSSYYALDSADISTIVLSPGQSTTVLYVTFTPLGAVPVGTEFVFHSALSFMPPGGGSEMELSQEALEPLHITVIPESSSVLLVGFGLFGFCGRRLKGAAGQ